MNRGDVVIAQIPYADGRAAVHRPALVVQADYYNARIQNILLAAITSNLVRRGDRAHYLIDISTPGGAQSGLTANSLVSCLNLAVLPRSDLGRKIGELSAPAMRQIDECLKAALGIP